MRVSQVLHVMCRDDNVQIFDSHRPIDRDILYEGTVRGVHRDSPFNKLHVRTLMASCDFKGDSVIVIDVDGAELFGKERARNDRV